jgi:hypothetical protein
MRFALVFLNYFFSLLFGSFDTLSPIIMTFRRSGGLLPRNFRPCLPQNHLRIRSTLPPLLSRKFHASSLLWGIKSQVLKDVGEGMGHLEPVSCPNLVAHRS